MPTTKLNVSLDAETAQTLKRRAREAGKPTSRYLGELIERDARAAQDALAIEGYQELSAETSAFANAAWPLVNELPWTWDDPTATGCDPHPEGTSNEPV